MLLLTDVPPLISNLHYVELLLPKCGHLPMTADPMEIGYSRSHDLIYTHTDNVKLSPLENVRLFPKSILSSTPSKSNAPGLKNVVPGAPAGAQSVAGSISVNVP